MTYCIYHIPGKKIGVTNDPERRITCQQGYTEDEYDILAMSDDIDYISDLEIELQKKYGYKVDRQLYKDLPMNKPLSKTMNINITEQTTTFPCPVNKLKGRLMDELGMSWETEHGRCCLDPESVRWIMDNVKPSMYNKDRCYVYNKAFARYFDNNGCCRTNTGALNMSGHGGLNLNVGSLNRFDLIRTWADERGLYDKGDTKTQYLKLMEEAGELGRAILKDDQPEVVDAIGDMVVVLTNLSELAGYKIEHCIDEAYAVISKRTGKMHNGTFVKDTL
jgi:NTP pyrophosphatase (non-canonical NTP hydrolase)